MYLNRNTILSYNANLNFIVLKRGIGKGWGFKTLGIDEFKQTGLKTLWVRRYKGELKKAKTKFLSDIVNHYPNDVIKVQGNTLYVNKKPAIEFMTLTDAQDAKSSSFDDFKYLIFDEFIIEGQAKRYIGEECTVFASLMSTFLRDKDRKIFMLGNKVKTVNPYTIYFNLPSFDCVKYMQDRSILVFAKYNDDVIEDNYKDTPLERILRGTPYYDYALRNTSLNDSQSFVRPRPKELKTAYVININGTPVGLFFDTETSRIFFDTHCDTSVRTKYTFKRENLAEGYMILSKRFAITKIISESYAMGRVFFNDLRTKTITQELLDYLS